MEAKLQKLKVTELKELLHNHGLVQTGKKDDLVKRLLEAGISAPDAAEGDGGAEGENGHTDELVDPDELHEVEAAPVPAAAAPAPAPTSEPTSAPTEPAPSTEAPTDPPALTADQAARKARAERFGIPFNPNPPSTSRKPVPKSTPTTPAAEAPATAVTGEAIKAAKPAAIDSTPLGISEDVLARRAAKFGPVEKKVPAVKEVKEVKETSAEVKAAKPAEVELTPEMKEKIAIEEEKKRKRAEKFGPMVPATTEAPDAKKVKV